ncbi:MAG TPA: TolC family protein [Thermoanaerobaculia bacterium]|nr:TolC family protein [Thermoanaerobaculia bacterium]
MRPVTRSVAVLAFWLAAAALSAADPAPLRLTLQEATRRSLERNTTLAVERQNLDQAVAAVKGAEGAYDILWNADFNWRKNTDPINSIFSGAPTGSLAPENEGVEAATGLSGLLPTGGSVSLFTNWGRATTNNVFTILSPAYDTGVGVALRQPLLKDLQMDPAREGIRVASADRGASKARLEQTVSDTMARVDTAYWNLVAVRRDVVSIESSIELAGRQLSDTKVRVESGALARTDVAEPTAELERRRGNLALARQRVEEAQNTLKILVLGDPSDPDWASDIVPADAPETELQHPSLPEALATGMAKRGEIAEARAVRERAEAHLEGRRSDVLPKLDLVASYQRRGLAGGTNPNAMDFNGEPVVVPPPVSGGTGRSYGTIGENRFPDASVGLSFSLPIGNRTAKANLAIAKSRLSQANVGITAAEQSVGADVRNAVFSVETARQRIEAARASREAAETQLAAEQERFKAGMSTNFLVLTRQNDLTLARVTETDALTDYRKAETALARATGVLLEQRHIQIEAPEGRNAPGGALTH